jgi:ribosomal protein S18 acetylase RimI-like enzyme
MASAAIINPEVRIISMADADLAALEQLFDEECDEWLELLKWDYKGASMLIRDVTRQRQLSGLVAISGNTTVGFAYYLIEGPRCSIGDIYVSRPWRGMGIDRDMTEAILNKLDHVARLRRIESQCVGVGNHEADHLFQTRGFERLERSYMLTEVGNDAGPPASTSDITLRPWKEADFSQAVRVIHRSYHGTHDSRINSQYRTEQGCAELLTILTDHIWCGDFLPLVSRVAVRPSGSIVGVLIASRVARGVGHIGQISVHPAHQGRGIGRRMIANAMSEFCNRGVRSISLAVTTANEGAFHLYQTCGFETIHTFPVFYREKK